MIFPDFHWVILWGTSRYFSRVYPLVFFWVFGSLHLLDYIYFGPNACLEVLGRLGMFHVSLGSHPLQEFSVDSAPSPPNSLPYEIFASGACEVSFMPMVFSLP